jgi:hypothetical protein
MFLIAAFIPMLAVLATVAHVLSLTGLFLLVLWLVGGVLLRLAGLAAGTLGLLLALTHPIGLLVASIGAVLWAAGHWHYALRNHTYKSPLARRLFIEVLPAWADPTRDWSIPTTTTTDDD